MITRYIGSCSSFRSKATVFGTLSAMPVFGDYPVREGLWRQTPLRWMKNPKVTPDRKVVENLPLNGGSFNTLLQLTPGVVIAPVQFLPSGAVQHCRAADQLQQSRWFSFGHSSRNRASNLNAPLPVCCEN